MTRTIYGWQNEEILRLRRSLTEDTYCKDGAVYWRSNDAPVPPSVFRDAATVAPPLQQAARDAYVERTVGEYRQAMANRTPEQVAEQRAEARAAMGSGVEMVNILTGERFTT